MMYCPKCHTKASPRDVYCQGCGVAFYKPRRPAHSSSNPVIGFFIALFTEFLTLSLYEFLAWLGLVSLILDWIIITIVYLFLPLIL